jgi:HEAT repeat protein
MKQTTITRWVSRSLILVVTLLACHLVSLSQVRAESPGDEDERILHDAGLSADGAALLAFFHARARTDIDGEHLHRLRQHFAEGSTEQRMQATSELLGLGPLALPVMRQTLSDVDRPQAAQRALRCLPWLEGESSRKLLIAAAHSLARSKSEGSAAALLAYLPYAGEAEVIAAVNAALVAVAAPAGKPDADLLRGLSDVLAARRAAAVVALCRAVPPEQVPEVRKLLKDPSPTVRKRTALALAEAHDAEAIPILIDLLADLSAEQRQPIEEFLKQLAGEWAPVTQLGSEDRIARKIRRDAWRAWWSNTDGEALLAVIREHTLSPAMRQQVKGFITRLGDEEFRVRETADKELHGLGRITLPQLREAIKSKDLEVSRRARQLVERIEREPSRRLPAAALSMLAVRKPEGAAEALLAYLPFAEEEERSDDVKKCLLVLALREGKLNAALVRALGDEQPQVRAVAAEALARGGGRAGRAAVRKLLDDDAATVRLRVALALARAGDKDGVPVLIDLLAVLPDEQVSQAEEALHQLAVDSAPETPLGTEAAEKKKCRDAWAAWWKINAKRVEMSRLSEQPSLGYTLICHYARNRVFEVDRHGKERWAIENLGNPIDAVVLPGGHVLIAEFNKNRVTERDFKGNILWQKQVQTPINVQRLPNGHTVIASNQDFIVEVDRTGKEIYTINNVPGGVLAAYRSCKGDIVCLTNVGQCLLFDTTGKQLKSFAVGHDARCWGGLDVLSNGHILIPIPGRNKVVEFDRSGKSIREIPAADATMATQLSNGHILAAIRNTGHVFEVDRAGKIVWEHKAGPGEVFRVRRR